VHNLNLANVAPEHTQKLFDGQSQSDINNYFVSLRDNKILSRTLKMKRKLRKA
jgi:hypothetical protein